METKKVTVMQKLLKANDAVAGQIRRELKDKNVFSST